MFGIFKRRKKRQEQERLKAQMIMEQRAQKAQVWLSRQILVDAHPLTPYDTQRMRLTVTTEQGGRVIRYTVPYARYQYEGVSRFPPYGPLHYKSPTAVDHWLEKAAEMHGDEWLEGIKYIMTHN